MIPLLPEHSQSFEPLMQYLVLKYFVSEVEYINKAANMNIVIPSEVFPFDDSY